MKYTIVLLADGEKGYTALVPALPGCLSEGDSVEEALDMVGEAIALYLQSAQDHGEEVHVEIPGTLIGEVDVDPDSFMVLSPASPARPR
jgi:predicted RNase H-like HicB family nuclease